MEKTKRIGFFKRLKMSLFELENYIEFTAEKTSKAISFVMKMVIAFALIMVVSNVLYVYWKYESPANYINNIIPEFTYQNHKLSISDDEKKDENKKLVASLMEQVEPAYRPIIPDGDYTKIDIVNFVRDNEKQLVVFFSLTVFIETIFEMSIFWFMIALLTSLVGLIVLRFSRIRMKFSKLYAISIYASTLSMILTVLYNILTNHFNVHIDSFEFLSMLIAYIYITAVIYMIRSDLLKQQLELIKIATVQAKVKEQLDREKEENKEQEDKKDKEKDGDKEEKPVDVDTDNEPDGSEI